MACKWIINDGELIMGGGVDYHYQLHGKKHDPKKTITGGMFHLDNKNNIIYFFGSSTDYPNKITKEKFEKVFADSFASISLEGRGTKHFFSTAEYLPDAIREYQNETAQP